MHSPPFPCLVYSLDGHSPSDAYFALPRAVFYTSTPLVVRDLQERLEFIEREVRAVRDHTAREFAALNEKLERLLRASEPQALPLGPVAEVLSKQGGHCAAELEGLRVQVVEVVADAKCLLDDIDDVDSRASSKIFEIRESAVEYLASQDEGALSSGSTTPLALSPVELPVVPILTPDQYTVRKPLPRDNLVENPNSWQSLRRFPFRSLSALCLMEPSSRTDVSLEISVASYASRIRARIEGTDTMSGRKRARTWG